MFSRRLPLHSLSAPSRLHRTSPFALTPRLISTANLRIALPRYTPRQTSRFSTCRVTMAAIQRSAFFEAIQKHDSDGVAVVHSQSGRSFTYGQLLQDVAAAKDNLLRATGRTDDSIAGERIAFLIENGYDYVVTLLACLASNAIAVPLAISFPAGELRYNINQSQAIALLYTAKFAKVAQEVLGDALDQDTKGVLLDKILVKSQKHESIQLTGNADNADGAMMLYTSGTTARPKGVLLPHKVLIAQAQSLIQAWEYTPKDRLLHVLPLHHIHGIVNALLAPILAGSTIEFMFPFNADAVWKRFAAPFLAEDDKSALQTPPVTFFTVVPTIWSRMLQSHASELPEELQKPTREAILRKHLRLNISGSAALPTPTKQAWTELSGGNVLLERYGMTEVGMALSCGLDDSDRIDGSVGWPLPSVHVRLVDPDTKQIIQPGEETDASGKERSGEIHLNGPTIFREYWRNPEATKKEFTDDGWFKTGDIAIRRHVEGAGEGKSGKWATGPAYFIQGRNSADIIKTGGEKVSALEIERELLSLPEVKECAVVALPSVAWGQKAAAIVVLSAKGKTAGKNGKEWSALDMRRALKGKMVAYKIPQDMKVVDELPRNAMGKINKKDLVPKVFGDELKIRRRSIEVTEERKRAKAGAVNGQQQCTVR